MTLFEGLMLAHLFITLVLAYKLGKATAEIETLYEGVAMCMERLNMVPDD